MDVLPVRDVLSGAEAVAAGRARGRNANSSLPSFKVTRPLLIYSDGLIFSHRKYATRTEGHRCLCCWTKVFIYASWSVWPNGSENTGHKWCQQSFYLLKYTERKIGVERFFTLKLAAKFEKILTKTVTFWIGISEMVHSCKTLIIHIMIVLISFHLVA